jgi:hypothetical protein
LLHNLDVTEKMVHLDLEEEFDKEKFARIDSNLLKSKSIVDPSDVVRKINANDRFKSLNEVIKQAKLDNFPDEK